MTYKDKQKSKVVKTAWRKMNSDRIAVYRIKAKFNISLEESELLYERTMGKCEACGLQWDEEVHRYRHHVDHDHTTGLIRGILCHSCNVGIGHAGESFDRLRQWASYLEIHKT